jgi:replicative DNA helicase
MSMFPQDFHREMPQAADAEKGLLSSILIAPDEIFGMLQESNVTADIFFVPAHAEIYNAIFRIWTEMEPCNFITIAQHLRNRHKLDQVGGPAALSELFTFLPTAANAKHYLGILLEKFTLREIIKTCNEFSARSYDEPEDPAALLGEAEKRICEISRDRFAEKHVPTTQLILECAARIQRQLDRKGEMDGVSTGFRALDRMLFGMKKQEMFVLAARPSMGKSALAMNIVEHVAIDLEIPTAVFSLEMSTAQLIDRAVLGRARVDWVKARNGFLAERDYPAITMALSTFRQAPIHFCDKPNISPAYLGAVLRRWKKAHNIGFCMIDFLQHLKGSKNYKGDNRQQEVAEISSGIKSLAKELDIPILIVASLNRNADSRTGNARGVPRLSDLRESGAIESDADVVALLHREEYYAETDEERHEAAGKAVLNIAKNRNGPTGPVNLTFLKEFTRFEDRAQEEDKCS